MQDEADWKNVFRLAEIGVKEEIAEGTTKIVGRNITKPILQTIDNSDFKLVDQYQIHKLSPSSRRERNDLSRQTSDDSLSTFPERLSTGGRQL